jgi:nitrite reductase/ring-hydroxylating ferredoxin subunit
LVTRNRLVYTAVLKQYFINKKEKIMAEFVKVAQTNEIKIGQARLINLKGKGIAIFNVSGEFHAIENACTHRGGSLAEGEISEYQVTCPLHGATFDVRTGAATSPPANQATPSYKVRVSGTDIEIEVDGH